MTRGQPVVAGLDWAGRAPISSLGLTRSPLRESKSGDAASFYKGRSRWLNMVRYPKSRRRAAMRGTSRVPMGGESHLEGAPGADVLEWGASTAQEAVTALI